jgi:hypothetical protein
MSSETPSRSAASDSVTRPENCKPVTIQLRDDLLQKLKIVAILQDSSVGDLLADAAAAVVKRDLKKLLGKLEGEEARR